MRKLVFFLLLVFSVAFIALQLAKEKVVRDLAQPVIESVLSPTPTLTINKNQKTQTSVFVPYWTLTESIDPDETYDQYIYFGITPGKNGIEQEAGLQRIEDFSAIVPQGAEKLLTLRMVDSDRNAAILKNKQLQQRIIAQTVTYASENGFSGVVLDLEMSAIPFDSLVDQITAFSNDLAKEVKKEKLTYGLALYGDTFYRVRPFDVKAVTQNADLVLIMAYDFHKSRSNPGPNFPLKGRQTYGYDFEQMTEDYLRTVDATKLGVIFGLFGYDWVVDDSGKAIAQGKALSYQKIKADFLDTCAYAECKVERNEESAETTISYTDDEGRKHRVWFEDMQSVKAKQAYLKSRGIANYSFWAYSYF